MGKPQYLKEEEVPEEYHKLVAFHDQFMWGDESGRPKLHVTVLCSICNERTMQPVNDVRNFCRGVRKNLPGTHRACKYPGRYVNGDGYVFIWMPEHPNALGRKYVAAHILAMSEHLGRPINTAEESVHHIDGDKENNGIDNLQLRKRYHGKGQAFECGDCGSHNVKAVKL